MPYNDYLRDILTSEEEELPPPPAPPLEPEGQYDLVREYIGRKYRDRLRDAERQSAEYASSGASVIPELIANIGGAIAGKGGNAATPYFEKLRERNRDQTVGALQRERAGVVQGIEDETFASVNDPKSRESQTAQNVLAQLLRKDPSDPLISGMSAAVISRQFPQMKMLVDERMSAASEQAKNLITFDEQGVARPIDPQNPAHVSAANKANSDLSLRKESGLRQDRILAATLNEKQLAREMKQTEMEREAQARTIPGIGTFGSPKEAEEVRKVYSAKQGIDASLKRLNQMYEGRDPLSLSKSAEAKAEATQLILQLKELANLGVLNGPDMALLGNIAPSDVNSPDFFGTTKAKLDGIAKRANQDWKNTLKRYQYTPDPTRKLVDDIEGRFKK